MYTDIKYLEEFIYDSKLKDLRVFSKQYFNSILYSMYKSNPDSLVCFTFGDFNKLGQINKQHSHQVGDLALKNSLEIIKQNLPESTIIARIAGDEFCFITPDQHKSNIDEHFNNINKLLQDKSQDLYGLSLTTSSIDSTFYPEFDDMYFHTELDVTRKKKLNTKKETKNPEEILEDTIYHGLSNYFAYYRLDLTSLPKDYYTILRDSIIDVVIHNLEKPDNNMIFFMEKLKATLPETVFEPEHLELPTNLATQIHNYITNDQEENMPQADEFNKLFKFLITDPLTGQCSKKFFDTSIIPIFEKEHEKKLSIRLFDLAHLKLSNDIIGHNKTDEKISELFQKLISQVKAANSSNKYFSSAKNCGLLLIENADTAIPDNQIDEFVNNALLNQRILNVITTSQVCNADQISETIKSLHEDCKTIKEKYKLEKINSTETIIPLQYALAQSVSYYQKTSPNPFLMKNKQEFVVKIFEVLNKVIGEQFKEQDANIFNDEK